MSTSSCVCVCVCSRVTSPLPSSFWAAGFAFSSAAVVRDVPYDVSLRFLFFGEEASMSARLWTAGWDFFAPGEAVVYHLWSRAYRRVFHEVEDPETARWRAASQRYVQRLLMPELEPVVASSATRSDESPTADGECDQIGSDGGEEDSAVAAGKYLLGSERSLEAYEAHIGVNFASQEVRWAAEWGHVDPILFDLSTSKSEVQTHAPV